MSIEQDISMEQCTLTGRSRVSLLRRFLVEGLQIALWLFPLLARFCDNPGVQISSVEHSTIVKDTIRQYFIYTFSKA